MVLSLAHRLSAALLLVSLLLAMGTAGAHNIGPNRHFHFEVLLNGASTLTVTEGQAATVAVTVRCATHSGAYASCNTLGYSDQNQNNRNGITITAGTPTPSGAGGVTQTGQHLGFTINSGSNTVGTNTSGTVTLTIAGNTAMDGTRTVNIAGAPRSYGTDQNYFTANADVAPAVQSATLTILDEDTPGIRTSTVTGTANEGNTAQTATFTVRLASQPTANVTVAVSSADPGEGTPSPTSLTFTNSNWNSTQTVTVTGVDDAIQDGTQTYNIELDPSSSGDTNYNGLATETVEVMTEDDDVGLLVTESGGSTVVTEDGGTDTFTVRLSTNPQGVVAVDVSSQDSDECEVSVDGGMTYIAAGESGTLTFLSTADAGDEDPGAQTRLWNVAQTVTVRGVDDMVSDVGATCEVRLRSNNPGTGDARYAALADVKVSVTNTDNDGAGEEVTEVLLPEVARAMADSRATAVRQRLERADLGGAPTSPSLTENVNLERLMRHGASLQEDGELDWKRHLLPQAAFALSLDDDEGGMGSDIVLWGGGDYRDLDGEARGVNWDGDVTSAHLGADRLLPNGLRVGLAATWSEAKLDYKYQGQDGKWELEMTSAQPYLGWTSPGGISLWAMAGVGSGDLEITTGGQRQDSDADMRMASAGARGPLYVANGTEVSLRGEAMYADFEVDDNGDGIQRQKSDATRLRVAVEARQERVLASGARLLPRLELGVRYDGGDGETGSGAEVGVGVDYGSGRLGLTAGARTLVANSDYDEWGANVSLVYRAMTDGRGLHITLTPTWGTAQSGLQRLWKAGTALYEEDEKDKDTDSSLKLDGEIGYGRHHVGGLLTPYLGMSVRDEGRHYRLGGRFKLREALTLNTECERLEKDRADTEHGIGVTVEYRW